LVLDGDVELVDDSLRGLILSGQSDFHIALRNGAYGNSDPGDGQRTIDATVVAFGSDGSGGTTGIGMNSVEREAVQAKIFDELDDGSLGRVLIVKEAQVSFVGGQLTVQASGLFADSITITGIGTGTGVYRVDTGDVTHTVVGVTRDIVIDLAGGDDRLLMNNVYVNGSLDINMGDGNDILNLGHQSVVSTRADLRIDLGSGDDTLDGKRLYIGANQILDGGDGSDRFFFDGFASPQFTLGTSAAGDANWNLGNGDDLVL
jgi:hypothetical protein